MVSVVLGRLLQGLAVLLVVALLGFTLTTFSDPVAGIAGPNAPDAVRERLRSELRLDDLSLCAMRDSWARRWQGLRNVLCREPTR